MLLHDILVESDAEAGLAGNLDPSLIDNRLIDAVHQMRVSKWARAS
jgi:hypothetical protein